VPLALARDLHATIPASELVVIRDAAHLSNVEQADAFNGAVRRFLDALANPLPR
jgi:pimeloyl-ACP methyl ester carboxylesterase